MNLDNLDKIVRHVLEESVKDLLLDEEYLRVLAEEATSYYVAQGFIVKPNDALIAELAALVCIRLKEARLIVKFGR